MVITKLELPVNLTHEENMVVAICPVFHVGSQGKTEEEALANAREALELYLEDEDVQRENLDKIFHYAVSIKLTDLEKKFMYDPDIHSDSRIELDIEFHGFSETSGHIRV